MRRGSLEVNLNSTAYCLGLWYGYNRRLALKTLLRQRTPILRTCDHGSHLPHFDLEETSLPLTER